MNLSGNTGYYKYQVSLIDSKNHKILDILPCRYKHELCTYFRKYSYEERCKVKYFISDLWETYKDISMTYFPKAKIVADRFHYFRYINNALNDVRKEVQKNLPKSERKYFFRSRKLFLSKKENLSEEQIERLEYILINYSEDLRIIYSEKETLLNIIHSDNTENAIYQLNDWIKRNSTIDIPKLNEVAKTYLHWSYEIKNSLEVPYSNGVIEGFNNKIKTLKRIAFGFKNFKRFRTRILLLD
jgi:transposase